MMMSGRMKDLDGTSGKISRVSSSGKLQKVMHKPKKGAGLSGISSKVRSKHK